MDGKGEKVRKKEINFEKNIKALSGSEYDNLRKKLQDLKELKHFSFTQGKDNLDINIIKKRNLKKMYQDPIKELEKNLEYFKDFTRYPVLFFYGIGNGILYKILLQNQALKRIIIFEKELELIFLAFNFVDFSKDLSLARLIIVHQDDVTLPKIEKIFRLVGDLFYRSYNLHLANDFYEEYKEDILKLNKLNILTIKNHNLMHGNDPKDAMQGIEQFVYNLPQMITHPSYKELLSKRKGISDTAIIVSTGPSLTKQLPLLKKYASKATIFCADSSYPILAKHGIKPDYVCMLERDEIVAECFNNDFKDFDKDIIFLVASLVHKKTISYLEKNQRKYILIIKGQPFARYLELDDYGYINAGMSVSHMAYELAENLEHKNIILIGQDLAYAKDGQTHSQGFIHANLHNGDYERDLDRFSTTAYGGNGKVQSSEIWTLFRQIFENFIAFSKSKTYNCTEGGAKIESAIEKPFKELCEDLLENKKDKKFKKLQVLNTKKQVELGLKIYQKIKKNMNLSLNFKKECKKVQKQIHNLTHGKNKLSLEQINQNIDKIKEKLSNKKYLFLQEILGPTLHHEQSILTPLYLKNIKDESDKQNKLFAWVYAHEALMENIIELLEAQDKRLKIAILPLQDFLEKKKAL
ncbi:TPA: motility associated factor glycosyltransferase family protein [Campylobacter jejuni]|uniref:motility associated factor glycosyltransferase family protein n=1 Tax=Campylobacter jejuni TaxID=197 RepID=UPI002940FB4A|nr:motility associated factor glycosyltransferase family protein [Campylobacter jejuni]HED0555737.1 motility associated factor glycosyltransferase family protein [Campylobacter jejuni]HED0819868.1 motility associated factor glycosyltransferase family protein [Campylobacter jejuni]HED0821536.1 motility associated factor glycosyltransferase family protein [Campylobacter jejuni]HED1149542.1 motility associated factor glycosyltransferase family protein [Campylobacter jejuni]